MKKLFFLCLFATAALFNACQKESQESTDDLLAQEIAFADNKTAVASSELPPSVVTYVETNYFETYIETANKVTDKGFEVILGTEDVLYCDRSGRILRPRRGPFSDGPCGRGQAINPSQLPASITDYVATNYPGAEILRAKQMLSGVYFVKINDPHYILIFKANGEFVETTVLFFHCRPLGTPIDLAALPVSITDYIASNYPGAEIKVAFQKNNGMYVVGVFTEDGRKIMGFDANGNFLFVRP